MLELDGALVEGDGLQSLSPSQVRVFESELRGVTLDAADVPGLRFRDVVLRKCDLSNIDGREGSLHRVEIHGSRLMGFGISGGTVEDVHMVDSSLKLASLGFSKIKTAIFERVDLTEASFIGAQLEAVAFIDCRLAGADFRRVKVRDCTISGTSLDGVAGIESLRGVTMSWPDVLESAAALAAALGIRVEEPAPDA